MSQPVVLAPGTPATLSFWLWIGRGDETSVLNVSLGDTVLFAVRGDDARYRSGYTLVQVPIHSSIATGGAQHLSFNYAGLIRFDPYPVLNIDDVSLQVADSDLGVALTSGPTTVTQGSTFTTTLAVGNAGPQGSEEVQVQYPLPAGATLVGLSGDAACSAPETAPGYVVHCDFGTVPAGASKAVSLAFHADTVGVVHQSASTVHRTGDPNGANNVAHSAVTVVAPPVPPPPPPPPVEDEKQEAPKATCTTPRRFTVPLRRGRKGSGLMIGSHRPTGSRITSARISGPKKFKARALKHTRSRVTLDLRRVPAGKYSVRTRVRVSSKRTISVNKTYTVCETATDASAAAAKAKSAKAKSAKAKAAAAKKAKAKDAAKK